MVDGIDVDGGAGGQDTDTGMNRNREGVGEEDS